MSVSSRALLPLLVMSLFSSAALAATAENGLLVSRKNSEQWQLRLISSTEQQQFSGVVESTLPFDAASGVNLENADSARLATSRTLNTSLAAWPGHSDGVDFEVSVDSKLCLRDTGSSAVRIFVGTSLADAIEVAAPVALSGSDACGDGAAALGGSTIPELASTTTNSGDVSADTVTATSTTTAIVGRKYHPGHYVSILRDAYWRTQTVMTDSIKPGVVGMSKRYTWRQLEPTLGNYNFSEIQSDLNWAAAYGMRLVVMIEDKTFILERPTPTYLDKYTLRNRAGGYTVVRWSPYVVGRFNALVRALGARFDSHPNFEGIATQETSLGFDAAILDAYGYTPEKYRDAYINMLTSAANSLPRSRVFWYMNFFPRNQAYIGSIASAVVGKGVIMGGPDVLPDNWALVNRTYPFYDQFQYKMPLFGQVEDICYRHLHATSGYSTKYWTMSQLFRYARDQLHVDYMFWVRTTHPEPPDSYSWVDSLPVVSNNRTFNQ
ncbi:MAG TPA: hypothetical protein VFI92_08185 [Steroidobacteraceae bacterium]|nr:hypothetical protein [Steroidobacteraceae bacterium]